MSSEASPLTRRAVFAQAWPIMLGQASIPLVGLVDTVVIGRTGDAAALAGVALGATVISLVFWTFGFLRMGMTGLTAQADGAGDRAEVEALLVRGLAIGGAIGAVLVLLLWPLRYRAFALLAVSVAPHAETRHFGPIRFCRAPWAASDRTRIGRAATHVRSSKPGDSHPQGKRRPSIVSPGAAT